MTPAFAHLDRIRDERVYGLFEAFRPFVTQSKIDVTDRHAQLGMVERRALEAHAAWIARPKNSGKLYSG